MLHICSFVSRFCTRSLYTEQYTVVVDDSPDRAGGVKSDTCLTYRAGVSGVTHRVGSVRSDTQLICRLLH